MKRIYLILSIVVMTMAVSCGAQKVVAPAPAPAGMAEVSEGMDVIMFAESRPSTRAYGVGTHMQEATARRIAETNARAALAAAIQTMVIQAVETYSNSVSTQSNDQFVMDEASVMKESVMAISKECVTNTAATKIQRYKNELNQYVIYVCIEHRLEMKELVKEVAEKFAQQVPQEVKDQLAFEQYKFQNQMEKAFEDYTAVSK